MQRKSPTVPPRNNPALPGLRRCTRCGHVYTPAAKWCPACFDDAGRPRPAQATPAPAFTPAIGQQVITTRTVHITGGSIVPPGSTGKVEAGKDWYGNYLVAFGGARLWLHPSYLTPVSAA